MSVLTKTHAYQRAADGGTVMLRLYVLFTPTYRSTWTDPGGGGEPYECRVFYSDDARNKGLDLSADDEGIIELMVHDCEVAEPEWDEVTPDCDGDTVPRGADFEFGM